LSLFSAVTALFRQPSPSFSERILPTESFIYRHQNNFEIQAARPVLDIPQIVLNAFLHLLQTIGLSTPSVDLGPAGDAGFDLVAHHVAEDLFSVEFVMAGSLRRASTIFILFMGQSFCRVPFSSARPMSGKNSPGSHGKNVDIKPDSAAPVGSDPSKLSILLILFFKNARFSALE
jgi:hypothetical protein